MEHADQQKAMDAFILGIGANRIQALHMADIALSPEKRISWTYLPSNVRRSLYSMIDRRILEIIKAPIEGEAHVYEWLALSKTGIDMMRKGLRLL
jgi:hypothetical protein